MPKTAFVYVYAKCQLAAITKYILRTNMHGVALENFKSTYLVHGIYKWIIMHEKCGRPDGNDNKIVLQIKAKQFYDHIMQELVKNREIQLNHQTIQSQVLV